MNSSLANVFLLVAACASRAPAPAPQLPDSEARKSPEDSKATSAKGDAEAQFQLGLLAQQAEKPAEGEALAWFRKAARQGHVRAQHELGLSYFKARNGASNLPLALKWLTRAAEQGRAEAWLDLGHLYAEGGPGVLQDVAQSRACYQKAYEKGKEEVWAALGGVYRWGHGGVSEDWPRAYELYLKAAKAGHRETQFVVGQLYQDGIGVGVDLSRAVHWYTRAAHQEYHWAEDKLGHLYEHGIGVARDHQQALAWWRKSRQHGGFGEWHLWRLDDPETVQARKKEAKPDAVTNTPEITLETEKAEYELDEIVIIAIRHRNVGEEPYSFHESHNGGFHDLFSVKDEQGREVRNPFAKPPSIYSVDFGGLMSHHVLEPGKTLVLRKTLNQCVHFEKPGVYTVSTGEGKPLTLKVRSCDPEKRKRDIENLVQAYRKNQDFPAGLKRPEERFGGRLDILRRLVFYNEPQLLPFFLDALEQDEGRNFCETGLRALPDQVAVLKTFEERLEHPEKYNTLDLLTTYQRLASPHRSPLFGDAPPDNWKRTAEITRKAHDKALQLLQSDSRFRYGYLVPGLLGGSDDLFLIDYLSRCRPSIDLVRHCTRALQKVKLGREHVPFLESLLTAKEDPSITDAAILQLVRLDRARYLPELKAQQGNFSPAIVKLLLDPPEE